MIFLLLVALFLALCVGAELLQRRFDLAPEILRKLVHVPAAIVAATLPLIVSFAQIAALGLVFAAVMSASLHAHVFTAIHDVPRRTYGEIFFPLGITALAIVSPDRTAFAYGVLVLGIGDGLAALVGLRFGRRRVPLLATRKTLWGTGAFFVASSVIGAALLVATGSASLPSLVAAAAIAAALTPVELVLVNGLDNLVLPALAGVLLSAL